MKKKKYKKLLIKTEITLQSVKDNVPLRVPGAFGNLLVGFSDSYFRNDALKGTVGMNLSYFSEYYANAFMPAVSQYYIQNEKKIGNYPLGSIFIDLEIKSVHLTFMLKHFHSGLTGMNYLAAPSYPLPDRAFAMRIRWAFND